MEADMFRNYFKVTLRNIVRQKGYSFINIFGLAVGVACCILILLWVSDELSYDNFHKDANRVFRVALEVQSKGSSRTYAGTPGILAPTLEKDSPQVEQAVRLLPQSGKLVSYGPDKRFYEKRFFYADPNIFKVLNIPFIEGNPAAALEAPDSIVISRDMAQKYFGGEAALGKILKVRNSNYHVTGIMKNSPHNTHLKFDFLISLKPIEKLEYFTNWQVLIGVLTYIKVNENIDLEAFNHQIKHISNRYVADELEKFGETQTYFLQPIQDIHLRSNLDGEVEEPGKVAYIYIFSTIAVLILLIACLNFINLATARSSKRAKEVGLRKVVGAHKSHLVRQFLGETLFLIGIAFVIAIILAEIALPWFNDLSGKELNPFSLLNPVFVVYFIGLALFAGIVAGSYPAFFLSSFQPVNVLKGLLGFGLKGAGLRKVLVILQFTISTILILGTLIVLRQLNFMKNEGLGFDKKQVLVFPFRGISIGDKYQTVKSEFSKHSSVAAAAASSGVPGRGGLYDLNVSIPGEGSDKKLSTFFIFVDYDFFDTFNLGLAEGRAFQKEITSDAGNAFMINETAVTAFGWSSPREAIGKRILTGWEERPEGTVIGVYKDMHYRSLQTKIEPIVAAIEPGEFSCISLKLKPGNVDDAMPFFKEKWDQFFPQFPFNYFFLDEDYDLQYSFERKTSQILMIFTGFAIFISCLGLFGLAAYMSGRRTREIGIRKVLGASVSNVVILLSREFTKWVLIANVIAWPVAFYVMNEWLQNYAYRTTIALEIFFFSLILTMAIAFVTVCYQAIKASLVNPVDALRYE